MLNGLGYPFFVQVRRLYTFPKIIALVTKIKKCQVQRKYGDKSTAQKRFTLTDFKFCTHPHYYSFTRICTVSVDIYMVILHFLKKYLLHRYLRGYNLSMVMRNTHCITVLYKCRIMPYSASTALWINPDLNYSFRSLDCGRTKVHQHLFASYVLSCCSQLAWLKVQADVEVLMQNPVIDCFNQKNPLGSRMSFF